MTPACATERVCRCGQTWWPFADSGEACPACQRRAAIEAVTVLGPCEDDVLWVERTPRTRSVEAVAAFLAEHGLRRLEPIIDVEGFELDADELYGWHEPSWWKPGLTPFAEEGEWLRARPGEPTAVELWSVRIDTALRFVTPWIYPGHLADPLCDIHEGRA